MCGIVGYIGDKDCTTVLTDGLRKLEYRGYDSAGVAVFENGKISVVKTQGRLDDLDQKMAEVGRPAGHCGIGHTRWATHGKPSDKNAHPHGTGRVTVVHNGIIENYLSIKAKLLENGYLFQTETDTEIVAKLLDFYYRGDPMDAIRKAMKEMRGAYALGILFCDSPDTIYAIKKDAPLIVGAGEGENFIASDVPAILKYTKDYYLLEDGEIAVIQKDSVKIFDIAGNQKEKELLTANWSVEDAEKGGFPHFMLKEIFEQPTALKNTISPRVVNDLPDFDLGGLTDEMLKKVERIHIVACGTAMHAGLVGRTIIEKVARIPVDVDMASEFRYRDPLLGKNDLVIIISQSGETADSLAALRLAKERGIHTLAVVNVVGSSIARDADSVLYTWAGPEIAVASTKAYSVQLSAMYLLAIRFALVKGVVDEAYAKDYCKKLLSTSDAVEKMLESADACKEMARLFYETQNTFFIGRGLDYALSMEGSLKLKEISYIHSEAYAAGELKHGTISLIEDGTPVVAVATQRPLFEKMLSNIKEVKARGAMVVALCHEEQTDVSHVADHVITLPAGVDDLFIPIVATIPLQLLAYYTSVARGCDVDKPRNLAKSVTVE